MSLLWFKAIVGPTLYRIYQRGAEPAHAYEPNTAERFAENVIKWIKICCSISYWTSPILLTIMYRRGAFTTQGLVTLSTYAAGFGILVVLAVFVRAFGRFINPEYRTFLRVLNDAQADFTAENKAQLARYDFDFSAWPVDFDAKTFLSGDGSKRSVTFQHNNSVAQSSKLLSLPMDVLSYTCVHTFGRRMLYPGALSLIQSLISSALIEGREKLVEQYHGSRAKVHTADDNDIDTMFVDRRKADSESGRFLVVCSEGNAGFYEVGCTVTPLEGGYSVLGWNHPGFWGSTGIPLPNQEQNAIDAVMQYAIHGLDFKPENIILFAWSIGGYAATWAAMKYPEVRHVVLDATFDDIQPLAVSKMPASWKTLVERTVRRYLNLNNGEQLLKCNYFCGIEYGQHKMVSRETLKSNCRSTAVGDGLVRYPGPVLLIRRARDEMITTVDPTVISSNRGNDLLIKLLKNRYPFVVDESTVPVLNEWLSVDKQGQTVVWAKYGVRDDWCSTIITSCYDSADSISYPSQIGEGFHQNEKIQLTLFLASKYMEEFDSTHCTPLPIQFLHEPWRETK